MAPPKISRLTLSRKAYEIERCSIFFDPLLGFPMDRLTERKYKEAKDGGWLGFKNRKQRRGAKLYHSSRVLILVSEFLEFSLHPS